MKNVLLLYPSMLFYKISIFNKLSKFLKSRGYNLVIWYTDIQKEGAEVEFKELGNLPLTIANYRRILKEYKIDIVINILFRRNPGYLFYIYSVLYPRLINKKIVFYGHGINKQRDGVVWNFLFNVPYLFFDGIILYSRFEKQKIWKIFQKKITVANNTLDLEERKSPSNQSKEVVKKQFDISEEIIVLTSGRLHSRKKIDVLANVFLTNYKNSRKIAWLIVGPDIEIELYNRIKDIRNIYYLGPQYDQEIMSKIFYMSDIYCIPGAMGLGIVEALFGGLPILTMNVKHGPEAAYLKDEANCFISTSELELGEKLALLLTDKETRTHMSRMAQKTYIEEATLSSMFDGFLNQLERFN